MTEVENPLRYGWFPTGEPYLLDEDGDVIMEYVPPPPRYGWLPSGELYLLDDDGDVIMDYISPKYDDGACKYIKLCISCAFTYLL